MSQTSNFNSVWGWRDCSAVRNIGCSSRRLKVNFQHPHGDSQLSEVSVPGACSIAVFWPYWGHLAYMWYGIHAGNTPLRHFKNNNWCANLAALPLKYKSMSWECVLSLSIQQYSRLNHHVDGKAKCNKENQKFLKDYFTGTTIQNSYMEAPWYY